MENQGLHELDVNRGGLRNSLCGLVVVTVGHLVGATHLVTTPLARLVDARSPPKYRSMKRFGRRQPCAARCRRRRLTTPSEIVVRALHRQPRLVGRRAREGACAACREWR